ARGRAIPPLFRPESGEHRELESFRVLYAGESFVDIGHVLTGIEGSPSQDPTEGRHDATVPRDPELIVTWSGDLGSALQRYIPRFIAAIDSHGPPINIRDDLLALAPRSDLLGDVDGINIGAVYDPTKTLKENLVPYYQSAERLRFHAFLNASKTSS